MEDRRNIKIEDKISFLIEFCSKYRLLWLNRDDKDVYLSKIPDKELRQNLDEELKTAMQYYDYIRVRKSKNNLDEKYFEVLHNAGVGGVFAFTDKIIKECKEISQRYDIKLQYLKSIVAHFGTLEKFKDLYITYVIENGEIEEREIVEKYIQMLGKKIVTTFDLSNIYMKCECQNYLELNKVPRFTFLIDSRRLITESESVLKTLPSEWEKILREYYGIRKEKLKSAVKLAEKYKCTHQNITQKIERAQEMYLEKRKTLQEIGIIENQDERRDMLEYFGEKFSIFQGERKVEKQQQEETEEKRVTAEATDSRIVEFMNRNKDRDPVALNPIEKLNMSLRAINVLKRNGIFYIEDLVKLSFKELSELDGLGKKSYDEIICAVDENGKKIFSEELNIDRELEATIQSLRNAYNELEKIIAECKKINDKFSEREYLRRRHVIEDALKEYGVDIESEQEEI